jgi:glutaredoxin
MVKIYSIEGCPYCDELKQIFKNEGIEFVNVDVNLPENEEEYNRIYEITKSDDVPIIKVGKRLLVPNVSYLSITEAVDLTKNFLI